MIHLGWGLDVPQRAHRIELRRPLRQTSAQRNGRQVGEAANEVLRVLHGEQVIVAALGIHPIARSDYLVRCQRRDDVAHHLFLVQPKLAGPYAVDIELERRVVDVLRDEHVTHIGQAVCPARQLGGDAVGRLEAVAAHLDVQGSRQPQVQNRIDEAAGLEIGRQLRQLLGQPPPHALHVLKAAE